MCKNVFAYYVQINNSSMYKVLRKSCPNLNSQCDGYNIMINEPPKIRQCYNCYGPKK